MERVKILCTLEVIGEWLGVSSLEWASQLGSCYSSWRSLGSPRCFVCCSFVALGMGALQAGWSRALGLGFLREVGAVIAYPHPVWKPTGRVCCLAGIPRPLSPGASVCSEGRALGSSTPSFGPSHLG